MSEHLEFNHEALNEYVLECQEIVERISQNLLQFENQFPQAEIQKELLASIYRDVHTLKGTSQLFGLRQLGCLNHIMEAILDPIRKGKIEFDLKVLHLLQKSVDFISFALKKISESKENKIKAARDDLSFLNWLCAVEKRYLHGFPIFQEYIVPKEILYSQSKDKNIHLNFNVSKKDSVQSTQLDYEIFDDVVILIDKKQSKKEAKYSEKQSEAELSEKKQTDDGKADSIRVQLSTLDALMSLTGELVLIRNQLLQNCKNYDYDRDMLNLGQRLNALTSNLQGEVMRTRMQPIGTVFNILTRVVEEVAQEKEKKIRFHLEGASTELDRSILALIKDPLMHIVRNAVDHGIESPTIRQSLSKKEEGELNLRAYHESGQVIVEIRDDGNGVDPAHIGRIAVDKNLITPDELQKMSAKEIQSLIFQPGFSTSTKVTKISGRGVGMDVVKNNVEKIGGAIDLQSVAGLGTIIRLKIPLTVAMVSVLIVQIRQENYAIPQDKLVELVHISKGFNHRQDQIVFMQGRPMLRLRGQIYPLILLENVLYPQSLSFEKVWSEFSADEILSVIMLNIDGRQFGLVVNHIIDTLDAVVKALPNVFNDMKIYSGVSLLGDGSLALNLDVAEFYAMISQKSQEEIFSDSKYYSNPYQKNKKNDSSEIFSRWTNEYLFIDVGAPNDYAIPLSSIHRIENIPEDHFELSGNQNVVRFNGTLLPIISLPDFFNLPFPITEQNALKTLRTILVVKRQNHFYGFEVYHFRDIINSESLVDTSIIDRPGLLGSFIYQNHVIPVVDVDGILDHLIQTLIGEKENVSVCG